MLCRSCHAENNPADAYCTACGRPLESSCPRCGHVNRPDSRFCGKCSAPLDRPFLSLVDEALRALSASGGERKRLTLLFADIVESTRLIGNRDPEDALQLLQPAIEAMRGAVDRHGGVVVSLQGDGILALFGAPWPQEDHALRACAAALAMQSSVAALAESGLRIRVGVNTGVVVTQTRSSSLGQLTYEVMGPAAHFAARMQQMAEAGDILLTAETVAAARQSVEATSLGHRSVRGLEEPVEVFRLLGIRDAPASVIFRSRPRLNKLAGRTAELEALKGELANAANGEGRVVGIVGAAGAGKSRLCFEFAESCRSRGIHVYEARVLAHAHATPYQPVLELLRAYLGLEAGLAPDAARHQVASAIMTLPDAQDHLPLLLDFVGLSDAGHPAPKLDPAVRNARLLELMRHIVRSGRRSESAVILIEDLHWIDPASADFIEAMADAAAGTTTMLLLNYRPGYQADWMQRAHFREVVLAPLDRADMDRLLESLLGADASVTQLGQDIAERAQGNPFFAEELAHSLVERGHLEGETGSYRLTRKVDSLPLPTTIEALLAARIDRLDEPTKRVLQCASVIGREVPVAILESVANLPADKLAEPLVRLRRAELLRELVGRSGLYAFSHPLIQEVCYQSLLRERRRRIHAAVANALKARSSDPWEERISLLAYHLEEAGELIGAAQATTRTALWAGSHDSGQALRSWKKVHALLADSPTSESTDLLRMHTCIQILRFGWREGLGAEEVQQRFEEARKVAIATGNQRVNAWIHAAYGRNLAVSGSADNYVTRVREALALAAEAKDRSSAALLTAVLSQALRLSGDVREALKANIEASERAGDISEFDRQFFGFDVDRWLTAMRGQLLVLLAKFDEARACLSRMLQTPSDPNDITLHLANAAHVDMAWSEGNRTLAEHYAEQVRLQAEQSGSPYIRVSARSCKAITEMVSGQFAEAADEFSRTLDYARRRRAGLESEARLLADLANARRLSGDFDEARRRAIEAIDVARRRAARIPECQARIVLAETALSTGDAGCAASELPKVRALLQATGAALFAPLVRELAARIDACASNLRRSHTPRSDNVDPATPGGMMSRGVTERGNTCLDSKQLSES